MKFKKDIGTLQFISKVTGRKIIYVGYLVLLQIVLSVSGVFYALLMRGMIDAATARQKDTFLYYAFGFIGLVLFQIAMRAVVRFLVEYTRVSLENRFKERFLNCLLSKNYEAVDNVHTGEWLNRLTSDTAVVADAVVQILPGLFGMAVKLVAAVGMLLIIEPGFGYILIPGGILLLIFTTAFRKVLKRLHKRIQESDGKVRILFQEYLESMLVVRAYGVEDMVQKEAGVQMKNYKKTVIRRNHFSNLCNVGFGFLMNGAYVAGAIYCAYGILNQSMTYGTFTAVLQLISQVQTPFANLTGVLPRYYAMLASAERLMDVERLTEREEKNVYPAQSVHKRYHEELEAIGLENAGFTYQSPTLETFEGNASVRHKTVVLKDINLEIKKGQYVGFTGPSGCGKSTVLKLFLGLYPLDEGERYLQFKGEREPLHSAWQKLFAFVPQGNHLMSGTIREIVAFSDKEAAGDDERIMEALEIACAREFVEELPEGVDTRLGERGTGLSEGQMQRLAVARAVFSQNPVLVMDEATSALDEKTERELLCKLRSMTDRTVLFVTHRPATLDICDIQVRFRPDGVDIFEK